MKFRHPMSAAPLAVTFVASFVADYGGNIIAAEIYSAAALVICAMMFLKDE